MSANTGDQRNWLERLADKIPGYSGYMDRERRRDMDKLHRERLADRLRAMKAPLTDMVKELSSAGRLFEVGPLDSAIKKLDRLENRVRFASYGYSGFFDLVKIEESQLDAIYSFDLALVEQVERVEAKIDDLRASGATADGLKAAAGELSTAIDEADRAFDRRYDAINNFNPNQPPGKPLFQ